MESIERIKNQQATREKALEVLTGLVDEMEALGVPEPDMLAMLEHLAILIGMILHAAAEQAR